MEWRFRYWVPLAVVTTGIAVLVYASVQQSLRISSNNPQIELSEEAASRLVAGQPVSRVLPTGQLSLETSLSPVVIIYNNLGQPIASSGILGGTIPVPPPGVFDFTKEHGQDRITWQPKPGVRLAAVITYYNRDHQAGFVLAARSLREVEKLEDHLLLVTLGGGFVVLLAGLLATFMFIPPSFKK